MTKIWCFFSFGLTGLFVLVSLPAAGWCGQVPMVEKHIFSPEAVQKEAPLEDKKSPAAKRIEREIIFTGVIGSPGGRRAMMSEKSARAGKRQSELYKEGDEIRGMTLKKIGSNFIILAGEGNEVKLNLYQGEKIRPAPPALPKVAETPGTSAGSESGSSSAVAGQKPVKKPEVQGSSVQKPAGALVGSGPKKPTTGPSAKKAAPKPSNPFLEALKRAARERRESGTVRSSASNAFLEAIKGAQQQ